MSNLRIDLWVYFITEPITGCCGCMEVSAADVMMCHKISFAMVTQPQQQQLGCCYQYLILNRNNSLQTKSLQSQWISVANNVNRYVLSNRHCRCSSCIVVLELTTSNDVNFSSTGLGFQMCGHIIPPHVRLHDYAHCEFARRYGNVGGRSDTTPNPRCWASVPLTDVFLGRPTYVHTVWQMAIKFCTVMKNRWREMFYRVDHVPTLAIFLRHEC